MSTARANEYIGWTLLFTAVAVVLWLIFGKGKQILHGASTSARLTYGPSVPKITPQIAAVTLADSSVIQQPGAQGCAAGFTLMDSGDGVTFWCVRDDVAQGTYREIPGFYQGGQYLS